MDEEFRNLIADPGYLSGKFANKHWREFVLSKVDSKIFLPCDNPVTVLTAGCTGAGKTEFSRALLQKEETLFNSRHKLVQKSFPRYVIADADDFYSDLKAKYQFENDLRQELGFVCIKLVEKLIDDAMKKGKNLLIDSSFSSQHSLKNIKRSLDHHRPVTIYFIYENPRRAWYYTQAREKHEGRHVDVNFFAKSYVGSIEMIRQTIKEFGKNVQIQLLRKEETAPEGQYNFVLIDEDLTDLDKYIEKEYNIDDIVNMINE